MLANTTHKNYGREYASYRKSILEIKSHLAVLMKDEEKFRYNLGAIYSLIQLLKNSIISLRDINDFEASNCAIYIGIPYCKKFMKKIGELATDVDISPYKDCIDFYWNMFAIAARYSLHHFIEYMYHDKTKKPYEPRKELLAPAVFYVNRGLLNQLNLGLDFKDEIKPPKVVLFSTFPSSGKTLVANYAAAWIKCLAMVKIRGGGILRIGNEDTNVSKNSQAIKDIIKDKLIINVFPELGTFTNADGNYDPFMQNKIDEWFLKGDVEEPRAASFRTSGSATNGIRINLMLEIDDPSRGMVDRKNVSVHQQHIASYNGDWTSRFDNEDEKFVFLLGTRFNNIDIFSHVNTIAEKKGLIPSTKFKNTEITLDGSMVIINIDCETEDGHSAFPNLLSDDAMYEKQEALTRQEYFCVYRQRPIPEDGLDFDYSLLNTYSVKYREEQLSDIGYMAIDPTRRNNADYLSVPIFKKVIDKEDRFYGKYVFICCFFKRKSIADETVFNTLVDKIIYNDVRYLYLENNTDTSLGKRIMDALKIKGYNVLNLKEIYNTVNKSERIANEQSNIINNLIFPDERVFPRGTDEGQFMTQFTTYSSEHSNKNDDAVDSLATFTANHLTKFERINKITFNSRPLL